MSERLSYKRNQQVRNFSLVLLGIIVGINLSSRYLDTWMEQFVEQSEVVQRWEPTPAVSVPVAVDQGIEIDTCFTPKEKCAQKVIQHIQEARHTIAVRMFAFTSKEIANSLIAAYYRGVNVIILCDREQARQPYSQVHRLQTEGINVAYESVRGYAHNKVMVIDNSMVFTGSYNYTAGAESRNAENLLIIKDPNIVHRYLDDFKAAFRAAYTGALKKRKKR